MYNLDPACAFPPSSWSSAPPVSTLVAGETIIAEQLCTRHRPSKYDGCWLVLRVGLYSTNDPCTWLMVFNRQRSTHSRWWRTQPEIGRPKNREFLQNDAEKVFKIQVHPKKKCVSNIIFIWIWTRLTHQRSKYRVGMLSTSKSFLFTARLKGQFL